MIHSWLFFQTFSFSKWFTLERIKFISQHLAFFKVSNYLTRSVIVQFSSPSPELTSPVDLSSISLFTDWTISSVLLHMIRCAVSMSSSSFFSSLTVLQSLSPCAFSFRRSFLTCLWVLPVRRFCSWMFSRLFAELNSWADTCSPWRSRCWAFSSTPRIRRARPRESIHMWDGGTTPAASWDLESSSSVPSALPSSQSSFLPAGRSCWVEKTESTTSGSTTSIEMNFMVLNSGFRFVQVVVWIQHLPWAPRQVWALNGEEGSDEEKGRRT